MAKKSRRDLRRPHPHIRPYDPASGRPAQVLGAGLHVWELVKLSRALGGDVKATARYLEIPQALVEEALEYAQSHSEEIEAAIRDQRLRTGFTGFIPW